MNPVRTFILLALSLSFMTIAHAQSEKKSIRQGNREFKRNEYLNSEISYRKAVEGNASSFKGNFNLGDALYKQNKLEEANTLFEGLSSSNVSDKEKAFVYHNLGNTLVKQQKIKEGIEAYKKSLRLNPEDIETKYNLSTAQRMLKQQQQQQQQNDKNNDQNKDKKDQNKDNKDQNKKDNQNKDQQEDQKKQNNDQKEKQEPQQQKISPEDARRMLEAIQNNEKQVQQKMKEQQAKAAKVRVEKNW